MLIARTTMLVVLLGGLAACGDQGGVKATSAGDASPATYVVTGVTEKGTARDLVPGTEIRLRFEDGRLTLTAGCNTMIGTYDLDGSRLTVSALEMTEMGCDRARMDQDTWLGGLFARPVQFSPGPDGAIISGDTVLSIADREQVSPDRPLVGTKWLLDTVYQKETASSVPAGVSAYIVFEADGTVGFYDGCNEGGGPATIEDGRIGFGDLTSTLRGCTVDEVNRVADAFGRVVGGTVAYEIEENSLTLTRGAHGLGFKAVQKLPAPE